MVNTKSENKIIICTFYLKKDISYKVRAGEENEGREAHSGVGGSVGRVFLALAGLHDAATSQ